MDPGTSRSFSQDQNPERSLPLSSSYSQKPVGPNNLLRSRAYKFVRRLDDPIDMTGIDRIALLPPAAETNGDLPYDEYYGSTAGARIALARED